MPYIESEFTDALYDFVDSESWTKKVYVDTYDCLLEGVFVPDMTERMQKKSMQQRFREMEPDVFDTEVSDEQFRDWIYC